LSQGAKQAQLAVAPSRVTCAQEAPRRLSLRQNFSWMFCAQVIAGILRWGLLLLLARMGGAVMVGTWALAQAITLPIMYLTQLSLQTVLVTDADREHSVGEYLFLRLITGALQIAVVVGVCLWRNLDAYTTLSVVLYSAGAAVLVFREILLAVSIRNENTKVNARSQLVLSVLTFAAVGVVLWLTGSLIWALVSIIAVRLGVMLSHDFRAAMVSERPFIRDNEHGFRPRYAPSLLRLAWTALPAGLSVAAFSYANHMPVYFLEAFHGREATGYFGGLNAFIIATNIVLTPLFASIGPRLSKLFADGRRRGFVRLVGKVAAIFCGGGAVVVIVSRLWAEEILDLTLSGEFQHLSSEFMWVMGVGMVWCVYALFTYVLQTTRRFWYLLVMQVLMLVGSVVLSQLLVPSLGLWGVIYTRLGTLSGGMLAAIGLLVALLAKRSNVRGPGDSTETISSVPPNLRTRGGTAFSDERELRDHR